MTKPAKDTTWETMKAIENDSQVIEMWLFSNKTEVDRKRLESYELLRRIQALKEDAKFEPRPPKKDFDPDRPIRLNSTGGIRKGNYE